jgi:photosystem II stability/assembly factor-like uncharacterized protein
MKWSKLGPTAALSFVLALSAGVALAPVALALVPPRNGEAVKSKLAVESLMLGVARAGTRMVAVGEFGNIILSDDNGKTWRQANKVPTTMTLTSVVFVNDKKGWAVGHDSVIITTDDSGENWVRQYGGTAQDTDVALLSVFFKDDANGMAVGAFNKTLETRDGGKTWVKRDTLMPPREPSKAPSVEDSEVTDVATVAASAQNDPFARTGADENHLNSIFAGPDANTIYIAAEGGAAYRSGDAGLTWKKIYTGYIGSFWGGFTAKNGNVYLTGMRGNIWRSTDRGSTFQKLDTKGADQSIAAGIELKDGSMVFVGLGGQVIYSPDGSDFTLTYRGDRKALSSIIEDTDTLYVFGEFGVKPQSIKPRPEETEVVVPAAPK